MRLLLTTDCVGGVWTFTRELVEGLLGPEGAASGPHPLCLVSFGRMLSPEQASWVDALPSRFPGRVRVHVSPLPLEWMPANGSAYRDAEPLLLDAVAEFAPDLLHLNQLCFGALPTAKPRLVTAHSDVLSWAAACRPQGLEPSPWLSRYIALADRGLRHATAVAAPSQASLADLRRHWPHLPSAQHVVHNGRSLAASSLAAPPRRLQAVTAGRLWDRAKNIASLAGLRSPLPLRIAGETHSPSGETTSLPSSLQVLGPLAEPALLQLFRESAIYIAPALYEPFGLAPLEAALCGCALILRDLPSLRELWREHALFYTSDAELEEHLAHLVRSPAELAHWQRLAARRAAGLSRAHMVSRYLALYKTLLSGAVAGAHSPEAASHVA